MTGTTPNLRLPQWQEEDYVLMEEFNEAFLRLDGYVDTVNGQLAAQRKLLARQINDVSHNVVELQIAQQLAGSGDTTDFRSVYLGMLQRSEPMEECVNIPTFVGALTADTNWTAAIGLNSGRGISTWDGEDHVYDGIVRRTIDMSAGYKHLTLVLYARGVVEPFQPWTNPQEAHMFPARFEVDYDGVTVGCNVSGGTVESLGYREGWWPSLVTADDETYSVGLREYEFHADGDFNGNVVVEFPVHCAEGKALQLYAYAVMMA